MKTSNSLKIDQFLQSPLSLSSVYNKFKSNWTLDIRHARVPSWYYLYFCLAKMNLLWFLIQIPILTIKTGKHSDVAYDVCSGIYVHSFIYLRHYALGYMANNQITSASASANTIFDDHKNFQGNKIKKEIRKILLREQLTHREINQIVGSHFLLNTAVFATIHKILKIKLKINHANFICKQN